MSHKNLSATTKIHKLLKNKLNNKKIYKIYQKFKKSLDINENFAVGVSGGPDSLALAFLAKIYSLENKLTSKFFIVDHKLRPESRKEAIEVRKILKKGSITAEILTWKGKKPIKNIQSIARKNRYELLFKRCDKFNIHNILLGHHQDDLFENFFIRMLRGSGLKGLISLGKEIVINKKKLLRPLLNQKKESLVYISKNVFNFYVEDPYNKEKKYKRVRIRNLIEELNKEGLDNKKFLKTINNLKLSNSVVDFYVNENLKENTTYSNKEKKLIINKNFFQQPHEVIFRAFSDSIKLIGKKHYSVRGKKLDKIIYNIDNHQSLKTTLGGCIIEKMNQTVIISKEH